MTQVKGKKTAARGDTLAAADRLHSAAIHVLRRVRQQDAVSGVGPGQLSALSVLVFGAPRTLGELAAVEQVKPPTMSRIVAGLERARLIRIVADPKDARRIGIRATAKGVRLIQEGRQRRIKYLAAHLGGLAGYELEKLTGAADILERLLREWH